MFLSSIIKIDELKIQYANNIKDVNIDKFDSQKIDEADNVLNIISYEKYKDLSIKSGNYIIYGNSKNIPNVANLNFIFSELNNLTDIIQILNHNIQDYNNFIISIYEIINNNLGIDNIFTLMNKRYNSNMCILDSSKKLIYNIFDFNKVNDIFPLKNTTLTSSRLYGYIAFEDLDEKYNVEINNIISIINNYLYENLQKYLISKDDFYVTLKNLAINTFNKDDFNNLNNINWNIKDNYKLYLFQLNGGLFKYRDMFIHGNRFVLDHPLFLYSLLKDNNLIILINKSKLNNQNIYTEIDEYINKYNLKYNSINLNNNLLNYYKGVKLLNYLLDNEIYISSNICYNLTNIIYRFNEIEEFVDLIIPAELKILQKYDKENNMELIRTLYFYLVEERSLIKAAKQLDIHRNSVVYRVNKINELVDIDLDNYLTRYNLIIGIEILRKV